MSADNVLPFVPPGSAGFGPGSRFRRLDLSAPGTPQRRFAGVSGRFGAQVSVFDTSNGPQGAPEPGDASSAQHRARVVRRTSQPVSHWPVDPAAQGAVAPDVGVSGTSGVVHAAPRRPEGRLEGFWPVAFLMIAGWATLVALGLAFLTMPGGEFRAMWR